MRPMSGIELNTLMIFLMNQRVKFVHNCQLLDLVSYLDVEGVVSRKRARNDRLAMTPFTSDFLDESRNVDCLVFGNFEDYGSKFHLNENKYFPNCYGPICLEFDFSLLEQARDLSVTLRSASGKGFSRNNESLKLDEIKQLFLGSRLKSKTNLEQIFPGRIIKTPELSINFEDEILPFLYLSRVWVDPVHFNGTKLAIVVREYFKKMGYTNIRVNERSSSNYFLYQCLLRIAESGESNILSHDLEKVFCHRFSNWLNFVAKLPPHVPQNFLQYLKYGTLDFMKNELDVRKDQSR